MNNIQEHITPVWLYEVPKCLDQEYGDNTFAFNVVIFDALYDDKN